MNHIRWTEVKALFQEAADLDPVGRERCLAAFEGDPTVRDEVRSLLEADASADYLERSALRLFVPHLPRPGQ
jgi:hypothetical protein